MHSEPIKPTVIKENIKNNSCIMQSKIIKSIKDANTREISLPMAVLYNRPKDYPNNIVARIWSGTIPAPSNVVVLYNSMMEAKEDLKGYLCLPRMQTDDPCIISCYLI